MLAVLERDGKLVASRLVDELGVSEDTVRRDLRDLAARGLVQRVHGGALPPAPQPGSFADRRETSTESIGFLLGPPLIGVLAGAATLPWALGVLVPAAVLVGLLARRAAGGPRPGARAARQGATVLGAG